MIDNVEQAEKLVLDYFNPDPHMIEIDDEWAIDDEKTIEKSYGWIFDIVSRRHLETSNKSMVIGRGEVVVEKDDGSIHILPNICGPKTRIKTYEADRCSSLFRSSIALVYEILWCINDCRR